MDSGGGGSGCDGGGGNGGGGNDGGGDGGGGGGSSGWLNSSHSLPTALMPSGVLSQQARSMFLKFLFTTNINIHLNKNGQITGAEQDNAVGGHCLSIVY